MSDTNNVDDSAAVVARSAIETLAKTLSAEGHSVDATGLIAAHDDVLRSLRAMNSNFTAGVLLPAELREALSDEHANLVHAFALRIIGQTAGIAMNQAAGQLAWLAYQARVERAIGSAKAN
jgi:hypothetical protein